MASPAVPSARRVWLMWGIVALLVAGGAVAVDQALRHPITIVQDGEPRVVRTHGRTVEGVLRSAGIPIRSGDVVHPAPETPVEAGAQIEIRSARPIEIELGAERTSVRSASTLPANILASAGIALLPGDRVWIDGVRRVDPLQALDSPVSRMRVERGHAITVSTLGSSTVVRSAAPTVAEALTEGGFVLYEGDHLDRPANADASRERGVTLTPSRELTIEVDGTRIETRAAGTTVGEAAAQAGLPLIGLDVSRPSSDSPLPADGVIEIVRIQDQIVIEQKPLPYETEYEAAEDVELDRQELLQAGTYGVKATTTRVRKQNGQAVSQVRQGEWVAQEPKPRVVGYGTKIVIRTLETEYGDLEYWRAVQVYATSYSPCRLGVSYCDDVTASGVKLRKGIAAVLVRWYLNMAFSEVYVPGYGKAVIADTGGGIPGRNWIDLGFSDDDYESWHNWVTVYFLTPVPQNIMWVLN